MIVSIVAAETESRAIASIAVVRAVKTDEGQREGVGPGQALGVAHPIFILIVAEGAGTAVAERGAGRASQRALSSPGARVLEVASYGNAPLGGAIEGSEIGCGVAAQAAAVAEAGIAVEGTAQAAAAGGVGVVAGRTLRKANTAIVHEEVGCAQFAALAR
jgi:hypothetical protein